MPPLPSLSPGYQFCTVEYLICGVVERDQLDHRGVQLVLVAHGRGAALEVAHVGALLGDDQRPLELAGVGGVDAEVGATAPSGSARPSGCSRTSRRRRPRSSGSRRSCRCRARPSRGTSRTSSGCFCTASENEQKMTPDLLELALEGGGHRDAVEDGVHGHARPASPARAAGCRASRRSRAASGSTSSRLFGPSFFCLGAE